MFPSHPAIGWRECRKNWNNGKSCLVVRSDETQRPVIMTSRVCRTLWLQLGTFEWQVFKRNLKALVSRWDRRRRDLRGAEPNLRTRSQFFILGDLWFERTFTIMVYEDHLFFIWVFDTFPLLRLREFDGRPQ